MYTVDEVARMLHMHPRTIRRYIEKGWLHAERIGGSWRISEDSFSRMFDKPETGVSISKRIGEYSADMLDLYLKGAHRLQARGPVMMCVFVFDPRQEPWVLTKSSDLMAELGRLGRDAQFDFTMTGSDRGLYRLTIIAPPQVLKDIIAELDRLRTA